jgi:hypothetical protein
MKNIKALNVLAVFIISLVILFRLPIALDSPINKANYRNKYSIFLFYL